MKDLIKNNLKELLSDDETMANGLGDNELIYIIDNIDVYGGFDYGCRSVDHNILLSDNITWEDLIMNGTIAIPETRSYISSFEIERFENMGYQRLDIDKNYIMGY